MKTPRVPSPKPVLVALLSAAALLQPAFADKKIDDKTSYDNSTNTDRRHDRCA